MTNKFLLVGIGIVGIAAIGVAVFFLVPKEEVSPARIIPENVDLLPPRSQERIVEAENKDTAFEKADEIAQTECADSQCFEKHYQAIVKNQTIASAFADLKVRYDENTLVRALCHPLVHVIGRASAQKYSDVAEAYRQGDHFCWSGYYHGVMEGILYDVEASDLPQVINGICDSIPGKATYSFDYYNCVHGLGHGVMYVTQSELFEALKLCDAIDGQWEQESYYGGVFMENVIADFENHFTKYLRPQEPLYPCTAVPEKNKRACYLMQTSYVLKMNGYNFADAFKTCSGAEENHIDICYQSIGRDASGSTMSDVSRTHAYCMLAKDTRQQFGCVIGAVKDFISYFHSDTQAKQLCATFGAELQAVCLNTAESYYQSFQ